MTSTRSYICSAKESDFTPASIHCQAIVLREYPAALSLTAWVTLFNTLECTLIALTVQSPTASIWSIKWDIRTQAALYNVRSRRH